jgi:hypothetical protein
MATKKVLLSEIRFIVRRVIKESFEGLSSEINDNIIPIYKQEKYNDNDGAYDIMYFFDANTNSVFSEVLRGQDKSKYSTEIDYDFVERNEGLIKNALAEKKLNENPQMLNLFNWASYNSKEKIPVMVKGSRKYKEDSAELISLFEKRNPYSGRLETVAKILGNDGNIYYLSPNTLKITPETAKSLLLKYDIPKLVIFKSNQNREYFL